GVAFLKHDLSICRQHGTVSLLRSRGIAVRSEITPECRWLFSDLCSFACYRCCHWLGRGRAADGNSKRIRSRMAARFGSMVPDGPPFPRFHAAQASALARRDDPVHAFARWDACIVAGRSQLYDACSANRNAGFLRCRLASLWTRDIFVHVEKRPP